MTQSTTLDPHYAVDMLSLFDGTPAPAPISTPAGQSFDPNDPQVAAAMAHARQQVQGQHYATAAELKQRAEAAEAAAKKAQEEAEAVRQKAEADRIAGLPQGEQVMAELKALKEQTAKEAQARKEAEEKAAAEIARTQAEATRQVEAWRVEARVKEIVLEHGGNIDPKSLQTKDQNGNPSVQALEASIPAAVQEYQRTKAFFLQQFQAEQAALAHSQGQSAVEGLPGYPPSMGMPSANRSGSVVEQSPVGGQVPQFAHPQVDGGQSYAQMRQQVHGRVQMAAPPAPGQQFFQPQYQQPQAPYPVMTPQGYPTGPAATPQYQGVPQQQFMPGAGVPQQPQMQGYPPQPQMGYPPQQPQVPGLPPHLMPQQPQANVAPLPDPNLLPGQFERPLGIQEQTNARAQAQAKIEQHRQGSQHNPGVGQAARVFQAERSAGGAQPISHAAQPLPAGFDMNNPSMHPMAMPRQGTVVA